MDIIFYDIQEVKDDYIYAQHNCLVKPNEGDCIILKNKLYKVISVTIAYEKNTIHVFVEKQKNNKFISIK